MEGKTHRCCVLIVLVTVFVPFVLARHSSLREFVVEKKPPAPPAPPPAVQIETPLHSGYIPINSKEGSSLYYAYWEASAAEGGVTGSTPIILWLQGGPGCASTFGALYELGPTIIGSDGKPEPNEFAMNEYAGLLVVDQPIGTGYSIAGREDDIPSDMLGMAADLYEGLYGFFESFPELQHRPLFITGESYAGKYVPSITHYILQAEANTPWTTSDQQQQTAPKNLCSNLQRLADSNSSSDLQVLALRRRRALSRCPSLLKHPRSLRQDIPAPNFNLTGIAIGNGLTDPVAQTRVLASVVYNMGLVTETTRTRMQQQAEVVLTLVQEYQWQQAAEMRSRLIEFIESASGVATLLDVRRTAAYDSGETVQQLLNTPEVKTLMNAEPSVDYNSCSPVVEAAMKADTMRSAKVLVQDILDVLPVLLYQGQFDAQDGVASTNAWVSALSWEYARDFNRLDGQLWYVDGLPAGWLRNVSTLTQVVVRNAGHMVPRDQPKAAQQLVWEWIQAQLQTTEEVSAPLADAADSSIMRYQRSSGAVVDSSASMDGVVVF